MISEVARSQEPGARGVSGFKFRVSSFRFSAHPKPETRNLKLARAIFHFSFFILTLCLSGCEVLGVFANKVLPIPDIPATYTPVKDFTLVLVESYNNPAAVGLASDYISRQIVANMVDHRARRSSIPTSSPRCVVTSRRSLRRWKSPPSAARWARIR